MNESMKMKTIDTGSQPQAQCASSGFVDDGEIYCHPNGEPYENGPVKCVKDCPSCKAEPAPARTEQQPIHVTAVAVTRENEDGELYLDWLLEGGICELEHPGQVLMWADREITNDEGHGEVYAAPIAQPAPQPEQSGLAAKLYPLISEWKPKTRKEIDAKNAAAVLIMATLA